MRVRFGFRLFTLSARIIYLLPAVRKYCTVRQEFWWYGNGTLTVTVTVTLQHRWIGTVYYADQYIAVLPWSGRGVRASGVELHCMVLKCLNATHIYTVRFFLHSWLLGNMMNMCLVQHASTCEMDGWVMGKEGTGWSGLWYQRTRGRRASTLGDLEVCMFVWGGEKYYRDDDDKGREMRRALT